MLLISIGGAVTINDPVVRKVGTPALPDADEEYPDRFWRFWWAI